MMKKRIAGLLLAPGLCLMLAGCQGEAIAAVPTQRAPRAASEEMILVLLFICDPSPALLAGASL